MLLLVIDIIVVTFLVLVSEVKDCTPKNVPCNNPSITDCVYVLLQYLDLIYFINEDLRQPVTNALHIVSLCILSVFMTGDPSPFTARYGCTDREQRAQQKC